MNPYILGFLAGLLCSFALSAGAFWALMWLGADAEVDSEEEA